METNVLSEREIEILKLVAQGKSNKEIAENLFISVNTVKVHLTNVFKKTGVTSRTEATLYAIEHGFINSPRNAPDDVQILISQPGENSTENLTDIAKKPKASWITLLLLTLVLIGVFVLLFRSTLFRSNPPQTNPLTESLAQARWRTLRPLTTARTKMAAAVYENNIYLIGGENAEGVLGKTEKYIVSSNTYSLLAPKPTPVRDASAVVVGGKIYVPGGETADGTLTSVLEVYDPLTDKWSELQLLPVPLSRYALTALEGTLFLFGGWDGKQSVNTVLSYNPATDTWKERTGFSFPRSDAQAAVLGDKIFLAGGMDGTNPVRQIEVYSPAQDEPTGNAWSKQIELPADMKFLGSQNLSGSLFVFGQDGKGQLDLMQFTPQNNSWFTYSEVPPEGLLSGSKIIGMGGDVFFFGGKEKDDSYSDRVQKYQAVYTIVLPSISK